MKKELLTLIGAGAIFFSGCEGNFESYKNSKGRLPERESICVTPLSIEYGTNQRLINPDYFYGEFLDMSNKKIIYGCVNDCSGDICLEVVRKIESKINKEGRCPIILTGKYTSVSRFEISDISFHGK
jgi:hypothetical protein